MSIATVNTVPEMIPSNTIDFLWLELTNRCNLECVHCYAGSSPSASDSALSADDYSRILTDAHALGCRRVQFIGGEPTLNRSLPALIRLANSLGFEFIEVYTNLVSLPDSLLSCFQQHNVHVAASVYSDRPDIHDAITTRPGSWLHTTKNIKRLIEGGVPLRASIIEMEANSGNVEATTAWLQSIGVTDIGTDRLRHFGRGTNGHEVEMSELCGNCASGTLCIGPDGTVAPCIMSKSWSVGSLAEDTLATIANSSRLRDTRLAIYEEAVAHQQIAMGGCQPDSKHPCGPDRGTCRPCSPNGHCPPNSCAPK